MLITYSAVFVECNRDAAGTVWVVPNEKAIPLNEMPDPLPRTPFLRIVSIWQISSVNFSALRAKKGLDLVQRHPVADPGEIAPGVHTFQAHQVEHSACGSYCRCRNGGYVDPSSRTPKCVPAHGIPSFGGLGPYPLIVQ